MEKVKVGKMLKNLNANFDKQANNRLKDMGLSVTQGIGLVWLSEADDNQLAIKDLEKKFGTSQPTTLGVISRLEQKGLVETYLTQQRTKMVKISSAGTELIEDIRKNLEAVDQQFFKGFSEGEKILFIEMLNRVGENILDF